MARTQEEKGKSKIRKPKRIPQQFQDENALSVEKVVSIQKTCRTIKGGRAVSFAALVVVGDGEGSIGYAREKARTVSDAINKALRRARAKLQKVFLGKGTILYPLSIESGATKIILKQAAPGTGIVANHSIRCICEALGITNILSKVYGSRNSCNLVSSAIKGITNMRPVSYFAHKRGLTYQEMFLAQGEEVPEHLRRNTQ